MVLCSNDSSRAFHMLARQHPDRLGWLISPRSFKLPKPDLPFAIDNDAYTLWIKGELFDEVAWLKTLDRVRESGHNPMWIVIPDRVADRERTLELWGHYSKRVKEYGWPLAFVVQDGMTLSDIPKDANIVFVGGTTQFKWRTLPQWCRSFPRVHVGRCGTSAWKLRRIEQLGAESCDGSGWFRATFNGRESRQLQAWLHDPLPHPELSGLQFA